MSPAGRTLRDVVTEVRASVTRRAALAAGAWALAAVATLLLAGWFLAGPDGWRQGSWLPLALDVVVLGLVVGGGLLVRRRLRNRLDDRGLGGLLDRDAGLGPGSVEGALELGRDLPPGTSPALALRAERGVLDRLRRAEAPLAAPLEHELRRWGRRGLGALAVILPLVVLAAVASPDRARAAWAGLGNPVGLAARPVLAPLSVEPGDADVARGTDATIRVSAPGRDSVVLRWQAAGDVVRRQVSAVGPAAEFALRDVRAPVTYWAEAADGAVSDTFVLTPVDPLLVADVGVELHFPPHTGRTTEAYRGSVPPLQVPAGTRVSVRGRASRPLSSAWLESAAVPAAVPASDRAAVPSPDRVPRRIALAVEGGDFEGTWVPRGSDRWSWGFEDTGGGRAETLPEPLELTVVPDAAPEVVFAAPARDTVLGPDLRQPLVLRASDDHGIGRLELVAWRVTSLGHADPPVRQEIDVGGARAALARPLMDLSEWSLSPGDTIRYYARVVDNAPAPQEARTPEYVLRVPGAQEMRRDAGARLDAEADELASLTQELQEARRETQELERTSAARREPADAARSPGERPTGDPGVDFERREDVRRSVERQADLAARVDSVGSRLEQLSEAMRRSGTADEGVRRDLAELAEELRRSSDPEAAERLRRMAEELGEMSTAEAEQALRELEERQGELQERLERSLERFRRAAAEQEFRAATADTEELRRQQEMIAEAFREGADAQAVAEEQEAAARRAEELQAGLDSLGARLDGLGEERSAEEVRRAAERARQAQASMQQAAQAGRQGDTQRAAQRAEGAAGELQEAVEQLSQAQQGAEQQRMEQLEQALRRTADDALALARRQGELGERLEAAGGGSPGARNEQAQIRGDVGAVQQGVRSLAENLSVASRAAGGAPGGQPEVGTRIGQAMEALQRTVDAMEVGGGATAPSPRARSEGAVEALNELARSALAGAQAMASARSGQGQGEQGDPQERMEDLAQQQGSLNNQAQQTMSMQLGQQAREAQMRQLAEGQQAIAGELGAMSSEPGRQDQTLGDLQAMADEARRLAQELAGGRFDQRTRERQERLFHRLLDAGRGLEKDEMSEEREAERPGVFERGEVLPLDADDLGLARFRLPPAELLQRLGPAERQLVLQYFERLNRPGGAR